LSRHRLPASSILWSCWSRSVPRRVITWSSPRRKWQELTGNATQHKCLLLRTNSHLQATPGNARKAIAPDSKSGGGNIVLVRVRPGAPSDRSSRPHRVWGLAPHRLGAKSTRLTNHRAASVIPEGYRSRLRHLFADKSCILHRIAATRSGQIAGSFGHMATAGPLSYGANDRSGHVTRTD
jgi:hypothetical protein